MNQHLRRVGAVVIVACLHGGLEAQDAPAARIGADPGLSDAALLAGLAGVWTAPTERTERGSPLDIEVFGPGAADVRDVRLEIEPSGEAELEMSTAVVDRQGRRLAPTSTVVKIRVGGPQSMAPAGTRPTATVISTEERFLDVPGLTSLIDGVRVTLTLPAADSSTLEFRFDTPEGTGSFGTTLHRQSSR